MRIADVSISRYHATIRFVNGILTGWMDTTAQAPTWRVKDMTSVCLLT